MTARASGRRALMGSAVALIAAVGVSVVALLVIPQRATAQDQLRVARVTHPVGADAEVVVSVPRALSGRTLPPSAFAVTVDSKPVVATVTREVGIGFDVALVIETSATATEQLFVSTKAAAVEFVLELPTDTRVALFSSDPAAMVVGYTADRAATVRAIKGLTRTAGDGFVSALKLAAFTNNASQRVTIVGAATASDTTVPASAVGDDPASLRTGPSQLFALGVVSDPLGELATDSGGFARNADTKQLVGAFDSVAADLAGRYRLTFPLPADAARIDVRVTAPEGTASASVPLSSGGAKNATTLATPPQNADSGISAARSSSEGSDHSRSVATVLVVGVLAVGVIGMLITGLGRRRARREPANAAAVPSPPPARSTQTLSPPAPPPPPASAPPPARLTGYPLTALCDDVEVAELRAAVEASGIVVSQVHTVGEALRHVVTGRARAIYVDSAMAQAHELAAAVRQRNNAGWSSCPTLVYDSHRGPSDPALIAVADAVIDGPVDASRVFAALATRD